MSQSPSPPPSQTPPPRKAAPRRRATVTINPLFKLLVWINGVLCALTLLGLALLAAFAPEPMTKAQEQLLSACESVFKMTAGAFIGLLGGRAAAPDRVEPVEPTDRDP